MNRTAIIDPTRTIRIVHDTADFDGVDRDIWLIVADCPVNGCEIVGDYHATRAEAAREIAKLVA